MRYCYNINMVNLYGWNGFDSGDSTANKDALFAELKRLGMKVVVRIEAYNASSFAFRESDLEYVFNTYNKLIAYVCAPERREQVAYFSLNMPVDDGAVHKNLGGNIIPTCPKSGRCPSQGIRLPDAGSHQGAWVY